MKLLATISALTVASAVEAAAVQSRAQWYYATADVQSSTGTGIKCKFEFWGTDGEATWVKASGCSGFKKDSEIFEGPFGYHVHTNPVGQERNCTKALGHLDPLLATDSFTCNPEYSQYCQHGDLSGKHGKIEATDSGRVKTFGYSDEYLRWYPQSHSILGRSIVIHAANKTRLACGDIISTLDGTADKSWKPTYEPSTFVTDYPTVAPPNPPQIIDPFADGFPSDEEIHNLPFPLQNPAYKLSEASNVVRKERDQEVWINGTQTTQTRPYEEKSDEPSPLKADY